MRANRKAPQEKTDVAQAEPCGKHVMAAIATFDPSVLGSGELPHYLPQEPCFSSVNDNRRQTR